MKPLRFHLAAAAALLLAGCAAGLVSHDAILTIETQPEGATIFEGGKSLGTAPVVRRYANEAKAASIRIPELTAVWPSGARETFWTHLPAGADNVATIERPKAAPGLQADLDHAKRFVAARKADEQRLKDANAREQARNSQRCRDQMAKGTVATADCN